MICYHKLVTSFIGKQSFVKELYIHVVLLNLTMLCDAMSVIEHEF